jgi:hypothetical protein
MSATALTDARFARIPDASVFAIHDAILVGVDIRNPASA